MKPNLFDKKVRASLWKFANLFKVRIEAKKIPCVLEFNQSHWLKPNVQFDTIKRIEAEKNEDKDEKLINNEQIKEQWCTR